MWSGPDQITMSLLRLLLGAWRIGGAQSGSDDQTLRLWTWRMAELLVGRRKISKPSLSDFISRIHAARRLD